MKSDLLGWDGKRTASLREVYAHGFDWDKAIVLCADADVAVAASWLVKHHAWNTVLTAEQVQSLLDAQRSEGAWETILHLVQALDRVNLDGCDVDHALYILYKTKDHSGHFVRAWSLSAIARIAQAHPRFRGKTQSLIGAALLTEEKPSVVARLKAAARILDQS